MQRSDQVLNEFLVEIFHEILKTEEACVTGEFRDLSLREMHVIEAVCKATADGGDNRASAVAADLRITAGTLSTAVAQLEKKGYLTRTRDGADRRVVRIRPTRRAEEANAHHARFHARMVQGITALLSAEEMEIFVRALGSVCRFFREQAAGAWPQRGAVPV